ncbi:trypsin-like serine protease [Aquimarina hainanensis]|uniref:Trypsin-like serine protease n=1 Tax=Aquimarina hainanensis TaxID=1578017 RepID=A0ABW5N734_9FLAO
MKKFYVLILSLLCCVITTQLQAQGKPGSKKNPTMKIKNGEDVLIENHPYQADLGGCGGTILGPTWILTAKHCVNGMVGRRIGVGYTKRSDRSTGQTSTVKRVINFPCSGCDLSLLELSTPLDLSGKYAKSIRYASADVFTKGYVKQGKDCYATGWGALGPNSGSPDHLQGALLKFGVVQLSDERIRVEETEGRMVCRGDSGGPLVVYNSDKSERILVGAVSGGEGTPCTDYGFWGNVANAASWIERQTGIKPYTETGGSDTQAPTAPANLTAGNVTQTTIDLTWTASTDNVGVTGYEVYQGNTMIGTVSGTRYQAVGLTAGTAYTFKILAKDAAGNKSRFSNTARATTLPGDTSDTQAPTAPTNLTAGNATKTTIDLSWGASTDNVGVTGYGVYQENTMIATVEGTRYQVTGLTANTRYSFKVLAMDAAGNKSRYSNTATATTTGDTTGVCDGVAPWRWGVRYRVGDKVVHRGNLWELTYRGWKFISSCNGNKSGRIAPPIDKISVYPVPSNKELNIVFNPTENAMFKIVDMLGRTVIKGKYQSTINISELNAGTYTLKVTSNGANYTTSFVKK